MYRPVTSILALLGLMQLFMVSEAAAHAPSSHTLCGTEMIARKFESVIQSLTDAQRKQVKPLATSASPKAVGDTEVFWSIDVTSNGFFQTRAKLRKIGTHCYIYVEEGTEMSDETVEKLASQFDSTIYPTDRRWFGSEWTPGIDGDSHITLLFLDIQDGWEPGKGYVAGYFFPMDEVSTRLFPQSNEREIVYLDTNPADPSREDYLGILAHEFQHMIHFNQDKRETKWLNEAFAQVAFYVCGYGHAPQAFQYLHNTDINITDFQNTLENYGAAYLWTYYLYLHYAGGDDEARSAFFREISSSSLQSMDSIAAVLKSRGVERDILQIFLDWTVANVAGEAQGLFGYNDTLKFGPNNATQTYSFDAVPAAATEATINNWAADYIAVHKEVPWTPVNPTMIDRVTLKADGQGTVHWNVNGGQIPPARIIPPGSTVNEATGTVSTPTKQLEDGSWGVVIGHFARLGTVIRTLSYNVETADGNHGPKREVSIFSIDSLAQPPRAPEKSLALASVEEDGWKLDFQGGKAGWFGGKKKFAIRAVARRASGTEVTDVTLDDKNHGTVTIADSADLASVHFVVVGVEGKKLTYTYTITPPASRQQAAVAARGERLLELQAKAAVVLEGTEKDEVLATIDGGLNGIRQSLATGGREVRKLGTVGREADQVRRFQQVHASKLGFTVPASISRMANPPMPEDQAHDNLTFVLGKNKELIHGLTHLMIDPTLLEGQIIKMWRLLEIARGFPHLPFPDGLAIKDFKMDAVDGLITGWANHFGVQLPQNPGNPGTILAGDLDPEEVKEAAKRTWLAQAITEHAYNAGLAVGQDFTITSIYFVKFIFGVKNTVDMIADGLSRIPVVGSIAKKAKKLLVSKLMKAINNLAWYIGSRMGGNIGSLLPIAVQFITNIVARTFEAPSDSDDWLGWTKEYVLGLCGKYLLTATPRFGYVDRGQIAVDMTFEKGSALVAEGTYAQAYAKVWDDGDFNNRGCVKEQIDFEVATRHEKALNAQKIAWITGKLGQVARVGAILDPTSITKIVAIGLEVLTAGVWINSAYTSGSYFFKLPRGVAVAGVSLAFDPTKDPSAEEARQAAYRSAGPVSAERISLLENNVEEAVANLLNAVRDDAQTESEASFDRIVEADGALDEAVIRAEAAVFGSENPDDGSAAAVEDGEALESFYVQAQTLGLKRMALIADVIKQRMNGEGVAVSSEYRNVFEKYVASLRGALNRVRARATPPVYVNVAKVKMVREDNKVTLTCLVENPNEMDIASIDIRLYSGADFDVAGGDSRTISLEAGEEQEVVFELDLTEDTSYGATVTVIPVAEGIKGMPYLQSLQ